MSDKRQRQIKREREGEKDKKSTPIFYGEYKNVRLSQEEYKNLKEKLNSHTEIMINKLSRYMKSSGKTYQNHYATILKWYEEDKEKLRHQGGNKKMNYDVGESLQIKRGGKPLLKTLSLKRYKSMPEIIKI